MSRYQESNHVTSCCKELIKNLPSHTIHIHHDPPNHATKIAATSVSKLRDHHHHISLLNLIQGSRSPFPFASLPFASLTFPSLPFQSLSCHMLTNTKPNHSSQRCSRSLAPESNRIIECKIWVYLSKMHS